MRVALESTIIAHGLPWPDNLAIGVALEEAVRESGAEPATIAVVDGEVRVGVDRATLERIARDGGTFAKASAIDLAVHVARRSCAATTVSATARIAAAAGIEVFATGGIGGVHHGDAWDVSHDLHALAQIPIVVVSAGAKAILDLPRTLEVLETLGVLVVGVGTDEFPAFYTRSSGLKLEHRVASAGELAAIARAHWAMGGKGVLACNPIPVEAELERGMIDDAIARALPGAPSGKRATPYLLAKLAEVTGGRSIVANRALALNNARLGGAIATALGRR